MKRSLIYGALLALAIAVVGGVIGGLVAGGNGVLSALVGTAMAAVFLGITSGSILLATRSRRYEAFSPAFFAIVLGGWVLKFVMFLALVFLTGRAPWVQPHVLFFCILAAVVGSLLVDVIVVARTRQPYIDEPRSAVTPERSDS
nr:hypothetical protein [Galbitalea soli]